MVNRAKPPFDNPELRRAMALALDRQAFIDILAEGKGAVGGAVLPPPDGVWGMTARHAGGHCPAMAPMSRRTGRRPARSCGRLGYGPDNRLAVKLSTRNVPGYRDPAVDR